MQGKQELNENKSDPPLTFRADTKSRDQLRELRKLWGNTSRSQVIIRCIDWVWMKEVGYDRPKTESKRDSDTP